MTEADHPVSADERHAYETFSGVVDAMVSRPLERFQQTNLEAVEAKTRMLGEALEALGEQVAGQIQGLRTSQAEHGETLEATASQLKSLASDLASQMEVLLALAQAIEVTRGEQARQGEALASMATTLGELTSALSTVEQQGRSNVEVWRAESMAVERRLSESLSERTRALDEGVRETALESRAAAQAAIYALRKETRLWGSALIVIVLVAVALIVLLK